MAPRGSSGQLATDNAAGTTAANNGQQVFGTDWSAIQGQLKPSTQTTQALTQLPMQAANSALAGVQQSAAQRVAKTNNSAGYTALADKLGRDKATADSNAALQGQEAIQNLKNEGIKNSNQLFGVNEDTMAKLYGQASDLQGKSGNPWGFNVGPIGVKG